MQKVRWGILSTAHIGTDQLIPAMQQSKYCEVLAIASRNPEVAQAKAGELGIPAVYGSYEELLADPNIEAVYNPLPNHLHVPWSIKALQAGKHVLCEKSIALSAGEARELLAAAKQYPGLKVMEAFMYRFHPQWQLARKLVQDGEIGELRTINTIFSFYNDDPANIRNQAELGGGTILDLGCYAISSARFIFGAEPKRVLGIVEYDPALKIDRLESGILDFGTGTATFTCSTQLSPYQRVNIFGTQGRIELEKPFGVSKGQPAGFRFQKGNDIEEIALPSANHYVTQCDLFSRAILEDTGVPTPLEDALANMQTIDAVLRSGKTGKWEVPAES
ncbi:MAG: dehydrogenase [Chloroflexi bacterium]|jgi:predicted dehydrogenase|nr:dehydrogenase [Chloroflexota bacterium]